MTPSTDQQEKVDALVAGLRAAAEKVSDDTWDPHYLSVEQNDFCTLANPANILTLIAFHAELEARFAAEREENERLRTDLKAIGKAAETEVERLRDLSEGVIFPEGNFTVASSEAHHVVHASTTGVDAYPTPIEARMGFKSGDVSVEGSPKSIEEVMRWRFELAYAEARATSAEARITAQAETIKSALAEVRRLSSALVDISARVGTPGEIVNASQRGQALADVRRMADAALDKLTPNTGEQSQ